MSNRRKTSRSVAKSRHEQMLEKHIRKNPQVKSYINTNAVPEKNTRANRRRERKQQREANKNNIIRFLDSMFGTRAGGTIYRWASTLLFATSLVLFFEDYLTSVYGYQLIPTMKATLWISWLIGMIPQAGQVVMMNQYRRKGDPIAGLISLTLIVVDVFTDVYFKSSGLTQYLGFSFFESITIFTIFSEILLIYSLDGFREAVRYWSKNIFR